MDTKKNLSKFGGAQSTIKLLYFTLTFSIGMNLLKISSSSPSKFPHLIAAKCTLSILSSLSREGWIVRAFSSAVAPLMIH